MKKLMLRSFVSAFIFGTTLILMFFAAKARNGLTANPGDKLTASMLNSLNPSTLIGTFYASTCPDGRKPADGTNGTPDLRGMFLRGLNSFDGGTTKRTDGKEDPNGNTRTLGIYQSDTYGPIRYRNGVGFTAGGTSRNPFVYNGADTLLSNETRPKNVGIIFCMKN